MIRDVITALQHCDEAYLVDENAGHVGGWLNFVNMYTFSCEAYLAD